MPISQINFLQYTFIFITFLNPQREHWHCKKNTLAYKTGSVIICEMQNVIYMKNVANKYFSLCNISLCISIIGKT